jgi:hypothetical protein
MIERIVGTADPDLLRMLKAAEAVGQGHRSDLDELPRESQGSDYGSDYTAERLAREAPEQYEAVKKGELSLHAAAVRAGIRRRRISVPVDDPVSIANSLERANREVLAALRDEIDRRLQ